MVYIGIDLGGTKVAGALFLDNNQIVYQDTMLLEDRKGVKVGELIRTLCENILQKNQIQPDTQKSIGISVPGIAYSKTGNVWAPNIEGWESYPLKQELENYFPNSKVIVESDRTCYILGEVSQGVAKGCNNAIFIAVGTGIGAGILIDGRVLHGASDIVGAVGWMALKPPYSQDYIPCGCFEGYASGNGIARNAKMLVREDHSYRGYLSNFNIENITSHEVFDAYNRLDTIATTVIQNAVQMWGMASANLVSLFNPEMVVFGGGVFGPAVKFIDAIYDEACKWAQPISIKQAKFAATNLPNEAGLYGSGAIAIKNSGTSTFSTF